jgi:hypothetical protein
MACQWTLQLLVQMLLQLAAAVAVVVLQLAAAATSAVQQLAAAAAVVQQLVATHSWGVISAMM